MHILQIALVISGFVGGISLALMPSFYDRKAPHGAIWTFATAVGCYVLLMAICAELPKFLIVLTSSLVAGGAGFACGVFIKKESAVSAPVAKPQPMPPAGKPDGIKAA